MMQKQRMAVTVILLGLTIPLVVKASVEDDIECTNSSRNLIDDLLHGYQKDVLPTCSDAPLPVTIAIDVGLHNILDVNEPEEDLKIYVMLRWFWRDCRLSWNATQYGGVKTTYMRTQKVWLPDIMLIESTNDKYWLPNIMHQFVTIHSNGDIILKLPAIATYSCDIDVKYFPFDRQICPFTLGSWSFPNDKIIVTNHSSSGDQQNYIESGEWDLIAFPVRNVLSRYASSDRVWSEVRFILVIERRPSHFIINLILPCLLITLLTVFVFYLPPESGEKMSLSITILLSVLVFLETTSEALPPTKTPPLIQQFFTCTIVMVSLSCMVTVIIINFYTKEEVKGRPPRWLYTPVVKVLGRGLCMHLIHKEHTEASQAEKNDLEKPEKKFSLAPSITEPVKPAKDKETILLEILLILQTFQQHLKEKNTIYQKKDSIRPQEEWKNIAMVMDRIFMLVVLITTVSVAIATFIQRQPIHALNINAMEM